MMMMMMMIGARRQQKPPHGLQTVTHSHVVQANLIRTCFAALTEALHQRFRGKTPHNTVTQQIKAFLYFYFFPPSVEQSLHSATSHDSVCLGPGSILVAAEDVTSAHLSQFRSFTDERRAEERFQPPVLEIMRSRVTQHCHSFRAHGSSHVTDCQPRVPEDVCVHVLTFSFL